MNIKTNEDILNYGYLRSLIIIISFFLLIQLPAFSFYDTKFQTFNVKNGLSHGSCTSVIQDKEGYIWIGTYNGLNRFDGYDFKIFRNSPNDSTSISNNSIQTLQLDQDGNLWVGTYNGLNKFDYQTEKFERFLTNESEKKGSNHAIFAMSLDKDGNIWCGTWGAGVQIINPQTKSIRSFDFSRYDQLTSSSGLIRKIYTDTSNNTWLCTWGDGLIRIDNTDQSIKQFKTKDSPNNLISNFIWSILEYKPGEFYIATAKGGFTKYIESTNTFELVNSDFSFEMVSNDINILDKDLLGNIWVGSYGDGLFQYTPKDGEFQSYHYDNNDRYSISNNRCTDFHVTDNNIVWIATSDGVNMIDPLMQKFQLVSEEDFPSSLISAECTSFVLSDKNELLISTWGNGILYYNLETNSFLNKTLKYPTITDNHVMTLKTKGNTLYAGTTNGLNTINLKTGEIKQYQADLFESGRLGNNYIRDVFFDKLGQVWLGTDAGLEFFNEKDGSFSLYKPYASNSPEVLENLVWTINEDAEGYLWVGTDGGGFCKFDPEGRSFLERYTNNSNDQLSLSNNRVVSTLYDSENRIWAGTAKGLNLMDSEGIFDNVLKDNRSLQNDVVFAIEEYQNGNIWFSTAKSLVHYKVKTEEFIEFVYSDGIQEKEFYKESSLKLPDGRLLFGGLGGFNIFHPDSIKYNLDPPNIVLTDILIFNKNIVEYQKQNNSTIIDKNINHVDEIILTHKENSLEFKFAALNYSHSNKNQYKYRLLNFNDEWIDNGNERIATYTNLEYGDYVFQVIGANNDGIWSTSPKELKIRILPPYHQTIGFKLLVILLITLSIISIIKWNTRRLKFQKKKLESLVKIKTNDLLNAFNTLEDKQEEIQSQNEEILKQRNELDVHKHHLEELVEIRTVDLEKAKNKAEASEKLMSSFLANISHEIRTPMNAIIGFSTLLETSHLDDDERENFISYIRMNSESLLVLIDDILDLSRIESGTLKIISKPIDMCQLLDDILQQYKIKVENKGLKLEFKTPKSEMKCIINSDELRIQQILRNLLENAIKFTEKGSITIGVSPYYSNKGSFHKVYVRDTGIGIPESKQKTIFKAFQKVDHHDTLRLYEGTGLGLAISKNLIQLLGGEIWVESIEGQESTFYFTLPTEERLLERIF